MRIAIGFENSIVSRANELARWKAVPNAIHVLQAVTLAGHEIVVLTGRSIGSKEWKPIVERMIELKIGIVGANGCDAEPSSLVKGIYQADMYILPKQLGASTDDNGNLNWQIVELSLRAIGVLNK
jgi:hypothetical protein